VRGAELEASYRSGSTLPANPCTGSSLGHVEVLAGTDVIRLSCTQMTSPRTKLIIMVKMYGAGGITLTRAAPWDFQHAEQLPLLQGNSTPVTDSPWNAALCTPTVYSRPPLAKRRERSEKIEHPSLHIA